MKRFDSLITFHPAKDLEEIHRFYHRLLGLPLALDQGGCRIYRVARGAFLGFCVRDDALPGDSVIITLVTDRVDEWFGLIREAGHPVIKEPAFNPDYRIYHCFVRDPAGNTVEIQRFEDPGWKRE